MVVSPQAVLNDQRISCIISMMQQLLIYYMVVYNATWIYYFRLIFYLCLYRKSFYVILMIKAGLSDVGTLLDNNIDIIPPCTNGEIKYIAGLSDVGTLLIIIIKCQDGELDLDIRIINYLLLIYVLIIDDDKSAFL
eukprot:332774_1